MFIPQEAIAAGHLGNKMFKRGAEQKRHRLAATYAQAVAGKDFLEQDQILENVDTFKYLSMMLYFDESDWTTAACNLHIVWRKWGQFPHLLCWERSDTRTSGRFYVAMLQYVLLFGLDSWVVTPHILRDVWIFNNQAMRRISIQIPRCRNGFWE